MTAIAPGRPALPGAAGGGVAARRAVTRWACRLLRREWRQQLLVLALLALTVAAAVFSVAAAYNVASLPGPQFGSANHLLQFAGSDPKALKADIAAARKAFGTIQVIGRRFVPIPGSAQTIEYRAENPHGPYSGPALALTQGRYPAGAGQVAVTSGIAQTLQLHIGSSLSLDGRHRAVAGIVENPSDLNDQFALVSPSSAGRPQTVTVLLDASPASFGAFRAGFRGPLDVAGAGPRHPGENRGGRARASHGPAATGLPGRRRGLRCHRRPPPAPARHARRDRGDPQAAADGHDRGRGHGGCHRRRGRDRLRAGAVARGRPAPADVRRSPDRPVRHPLEPGRPGHGAGGRDGDQRGVVASPGGRPPPGHPRPVGPAAAAQARPPPGPAGRPADRDRRRLPGPGQPVPPPADHRRSTGDGPGHLVHQPAGHPGTGRGRQAGAGRGTAGAARPRPSPGPLRGGPGRDQPGARDHRGDHHQLRRRQSRRGRGQPARHPDRGLDRPARGSGLARPDPDARPAGCPGRRGAPDRRIAAPRRRDRPQHARQPG